jgi:triphosphoribosyl-dephospho-CoA synthase
MTTVPTPEQIADDFVAACRAELAALKPGNVHAYAAGHRMETAQFEASAVAAAPFISARGVHVGDRIDGAVAATKAAVGCNTNLGIVLLCAPLAAAAERSDGPLRVRLATVLSSLDIADARATYRAIALADPAGLGSVPDADVANVPTITLRAAMALARDHDRIANAYLNDFADIFDFALPLYHTALLSARTSTHAITTLHMSLLATVPDSHIARKHGTKTARDVQLEASRLRTTFEPAVDDAGFAQLLAFDASLKSRNLNPGTTADFVVATLFTDRLLNPRRSVPSGN